MAEPTGSLSRAARTLAPPPPPPEEKKATPEEIFQALTLAGISAKETAEKKEAEKKPPPKDATAGAFTIPVARFEGRGDKIYVLNFRNGEYRPVSNEQAIVLGIDPNKVQTIKAQYRAGGADHFDYSKALGFKPIMSERPLMPEEMLLGLGRSREWGTVESGGVVSANMTDVVKSLPTEKLNAFLTWAYQNRAGENLYPIITSEVGRRQDKAAAEAKEPGLAAIKAGLDIPPSVKEEDKKAPFVPPKDDDKDKDKDKDLADRTLQLGEIKGPEIKPFDFTASTKGAELEKGIVETGLGELRTKAAEETRIGLGEFAERGRRGGVVTEFQRGIQAQEAKAAGDLRLGAAETRAKVESGERETAFKEFIAQRQDELGGFIRESEGKQAGVDLAWTKIASDQQLTFEEAQGAFDGLVAQLNLGLKAKSIKIQEDINAGKMTLKEGEIAMEQAKNDSINTQNTIQVSLNDAVKGKLKFDQKNSIGNVIVKIGNFFKKVF